MFWPFADTEPNALEPIHRDGPDIWAQAHFAVDEEMAVKAEDIAARRTTLGLRGLASAQVLGKLGRPGWLSEDGRAAQALGRTCAKIRKLGSPSGSSWNSGLTHPRSSSRPS